MTTTITDHVARFVEIKRSLGYRFTQNERMLRSFARFAEARNETCIRSGTALEWVSTSKAASSQVRVKKLHVLHDLALWLHAEDDGVLVSRMRSFSAGLARTYISVVLRSV